MGLHRDPASYTTNPIETQIRRLLWFHIGFLDIRTCESTGPHPQIRRDEFDTHFPLNVDDDRLQKAAERGEQVFEDSKYFTDMTITRMRFECYEMHRVMWTERPKMQRPVREGEKKTTLTSLLSRIQAFKAAMEKTYLPMMNKSNPQHAVAMEMYNISSARLYINVLHPFNSSTEQTMPTRLRNIMISSCIMIVEHSMNIEQQPALKQWAWYMGALHQYHVGLLFLTEMAHMGARNTTETDATRLDRIWRCIDYCFELPSDINRLEKIRMILKELSDRCGAYATMRRIRGPKNLELPNMPDQTEGGRRTSQNLRAEGIEGRDRSLSAQSSSGGTTQDMNTQVQKHFLPQQQPPSPLPEQPQQYNRPSMPPKGPLGSMPLVDWGTFDMGTASPQPPPLQYSADPAYNFSSYIPTPPKAPAPNLLNAVNAGAGSDRSNSTVANSLGGGSGAAPSPILAAINDIDWVSTLAFLSAMILLGIRSMENTPSLTRYSMQNEWEQLFGGAQMGAGDILIPPFTFPSFEPSDLQWSNQGGSL